MLNDAYCLPPEPLVELVDAPRSPLTSTSPDGGWLLVARLPTHLSLADLSRPELKLAGFRFDPQRRAPSRSLDYHDFKLQPLAPDGVELDVIGLPVKPRLDHPEWSPDGRWLAFTHTDGQPGIQLGVIDVETRRARILPGVRLNACFPTSPYGWTCDNRLILRTLVEGEPPVAPVVPGGPLIQENLAGKSPARTLEDLLKSPHDEDLFAFYLNSQLSVFDLATDTLRVLAGPALFTWASPSPDARYLLVRTVHRPFSYALGADSFPRRTEILELASGQPVRLVDDAPLADKVPSDFDAVREGPREIQWRADRPAELVWVEALDGGDPRRQCDLRERVLHLAAPFEGEPETLLELEFRFRGLRWSDDELALVYERWWKSRRTRTWKFAPGSPPELLFDLSFEDRYADPGAPAMVRQPNGQVTLRRSPDRRSLYLIGAGASPEGDRPFLDRFHLDTRETERLWRSEAPAFELVSRLLDPDRILTRRESPGQPPNLVLRELSAGTARAVTAFAHPAPKMATLHKELIRYQRSDGVNLSGTLYLPPDYDHERDGPLPVLLWAYPSEYKTAAAAGQIKDSPYRYVQPWWGGPEFFAFRGYAVLDDPTFPIVGSDETEPNDTYVEQLVASAGAAVEELARRGVGDPARCAIGGHSYGAFTAANLLAHSNLFRAGIARSGAYNRTLTPFGFQSEERTFWEARETYLKMSAFNYADQIHQPLLLIHGAEDNNSGTYPIQSERLYQAIKGLGGTARLVMLPKESHAYRARESILHTLYEMDRWLETYVK